MKFLLTKKPAFRIPQTDIGSDIEISLLWWIFGILHTWSVLYTCKHPMSKQLMEWATWRHLDTDIGTVTSDRRSVLYHWSIYRTRNHPRGHGARCFWSMSHGPGYKLFDRYHWEISQMAKLFNFPFKEKSGK